MMRVLDSVLAIGVLLGAASAGHAVTLRYRAEVGQVTVYHFELTRRGRTEIGSDVGRGVDFTTGAIVQKVTKVEGDRVGWDSRCSHCERSTWSPGDAHPLVEQLPAGTRTGVSDALGNISWDMPSDDGEPMGWNAAYEFALDQTHVLPEGDVQVGDTWGNGERLFRLPLLDPEWEITVRYTRTLKALERYREHDCARIEVEFSGTALPATRFYDGPFPAPPADKTRITFTGQRVCWLDIEAGLEVGTRMTATVVYDDPGNFKTTWAESDILLLKE